MKKFLKENSELLWFSVVLFKGIWYFLTQHIGLEYHNVYCTVDKMVPFMPAFVIPYVIWYLYIPVLMLCLYIYNRKFFVIQAKGYLLGVIISGLIFVIYPTSIDFRPVVTGNDVFSLLISLIYSNDHPVNVLPSLHCFEALFIYLTTFYGLKIAKKKENTCLLNWDKIHLWEISFGALAILICLSTMFIKQHSFLDVVSASFLAVLLFLISKGYVKSQKIQVL